MNDLSYLKLQSLTALSVWTLMIGGFLWYDEDSARTHMMELARKEARANFNKDLAFRLWATRHGGVYVPSDERTPPNPALAHVPERDIVTPSGKRLTLMNPAYMLRQLMTEFTELYGIKGKITSLKLMNPANAPDDWETAALHKFEQGEKEVSEIADIDGAPYLRLMGAMEVKPGCLKCHAVQDYKVGDIRGGVGVAVPMQSNYAELAQSIRQKILTFGVIWLAGMLGLGILYRLGRRRLLERSAATDMLQRQHNAIEAANAELTQFANISAHHLMEPSRRLLSFAQRLHTKLDGKLNDADAQASLAFIEEGATRMRDLVRDIERYLTASTPRAPLQENDPKAVLAAVEKRLAGLIATSGAHIETQSLVSVYLDRPRLFDLFEVLIGNALIHVRAGSTPTIRISAVKQNTKTRLRIEDNGPGIPDEYRQRVFGVFERLAPNPRAGTGIGLAIARRIIESRDGKIWIESSTLGGIAVVFELPTPH
jgi:signal transduction histidine kinase